MINFKLSKLGFSLLVILVLLMTGTAITRFFDISLAEYIPYVTWILSLAIFFAILPKNVGTIFLPKDN